VKGPLPKADRHPQLHRSCSHLMDTSPESDCIHDLVLTVSLVSRLLIARWPCICPRFFSNWTNVKVNVCFCLSHWLPQLTLTVNTYFTQCHICQQLAMVKTECMFLISSATMLNLWNPS